MKIAEFAEKHEILSEFPSSKQVSNKLVDFVTETTIELSSIEATYSRDNTGVIEYVQEGKYFPIFTELSTLYKGIFNKKFLYEMYGTC